METVLIVDDEENIREGIKLIIDWEELGFEIIGDASNGEEALSAAEKMNPSLIVIDMQMPKVHGIDVIKQLRNRGYNGYFIILSGFSNFYYAKEAIVNNVANYITKPIDEDELLATVKRIKADIDKSRNEGSRLVEIKSKARSVIVRDLLLGVPVTEENLISMDLLYPRYQVIIHETYNSGKETVGYRLSDLISVFLDEKSYEITTVERNECILLKGRTAISRFEDFISHYQKSPIESDSPLDNIFIAIGNECEHFLDIVSSYERAKWLAKRRFFCDEGEHFIRKENKDLQSVSDSKDNKAQKDFFENVMNAIACGNRNMVVNALDEIYEYVKKHEAESTDACLFMTEIMLSLKEKLTRQYSVLSDVFDTNAGIIEFIESRFYLYEIIQYISDTMDIVMNKIYCRQDGENVIEDIIFYIDRFYAQPLTLEELALQFGYNSGYLGRLFAKTTGCGFTYYLNECRIKKAKELLLEGRHKVYEVSQLVGYSDVDYFGRKFRKHAGLTPAEFKKMRDKC
ncbi:response regulator [Butyrivibrio sp. YAB3001]|uniref:response regulator n=1 Tax=Butyrivibrio sp. YAB3001 TaxID=1520812 RepID=UPI0008F67E8E|nr:response regulator [Butyrivibrio sp. YAB3001]SFC53853.1 two-component system, response regulator YesN [Butyrivibrio sp. YAB3001]